MKMMPASVAALNKIFPDQWLRQGARRFKIVERETKVNFVVLFWTLVIAPFSVTSMKFADLQRAFDGMAGTTLASSAFQGRLSKQLAAFLLAAVHHAIKHVKVQLASIPGTKAVVAYGPKLLQELLVFLGLAPIYDLDLLILAASLDPNRQRGKLRKRLRNENPHPPQTRARTASDA
jgi:hypothetical protein